MSAFRLPLWVVTVSMLGCQSPRYLVQLEVQSPASQCAKGRTLRLQGVATYNDGSVEQVTSQVLWSSSNEAVAAVSNEEGRVGTVSCLSEGQATIEGELDGARQRVTIRVGGPIMDSIEVRAANGDASELATGMSRSFSAHAVFSDGTRTDATTSATWSSSDEQVAEVSAGQVTAMGAGHARVSARMGNVVGSVEIVTAAARLTRLALTPPALSLAKGTSGQWVLMGSYTDGSSRDVSASAQWTSSDPSVAAVQGGQVAGQAVGEADIEATLDGLSASARVQVTGAEVVVLRVEPAAPDLPVGVSQRLLAMATFTDGSQQDLTRDVQWSVSNSQVLALESPSGNLVWAVAEGTAEVRATFGQVTGSARWTVVQARLTELRITPADAQVPRLSNQQFSAVGVYTDGSTRNLTAEAGWSSSDPAVLSISSAGLARGLTEGVVQVRASYLGRNPSVNVTVGRAALSRVEIWPVAAAVAKGRAQAFVATGHYADGSTADVTQQAVWSSSAPSVALMANGPVQFGVASTFSVGGAVITAAVGGISSIANLSVGPAVLEQVQVTPPTLSLAKGTAAQLAATAVYSDGTTANVTSAAQWTASDGNLAAFTQTPGEISALAEGQVVARASWSQLEGTAAITVTAARLTSIGVTPSNQTLPAGTQLPYAAVGVFSDGSSQDLTAQVTWSTSSAHAVVSNAPATVGRVTALSQGATSVRASLGGLVGSTSLSISAAALVSISVSPASVTLPAGVSAQLTATGHYTDGSTQDLTAAALWSSSAPSLVSVNTGLARAEAQGVAQVSAAFGGRSGSAQVTATVARLDRINLVPLNASIAQATTRQLYAYGTYSDLSTVDITQSVTWSSTNTSVAMVSNATGSHGLATAISAGTVTVGALKDGVQASTQLTVLPGTITRIDVVPLNPSAAKGTVRQLYAQATLSDGSTQDVTAQATWSSSIISVATVSNASGSRGLATAVGLGVTIITATVGTTGGNTTLTVTAPALVSISLTPLAPSVSIGSTVALSAFGTFTDGSVADITAVATWQSSDSAVASVSNSPGSQGLVSGLSTGAASISAGLDGKQASTTVAVGP